MSAFRAIQKAQRFGGRGALLHQSSEEWTIIVGTSLPTSTVADLPVNGVGITPEASKDALLVRIVTAANAQKFCSDTDMFALAGTQRDFFLGASIAQEALIGLWKREYKKALAAGRPTKSLVQFIDTNVVIDRKPPIPGGPVLTHYTKIQIATIAWSRHDKAALDFGFVQKFDELVRTRAPKHQVQRMIKILRFLRAQPSGAL